MHLDSLSNKVVRGTEMYFCSLFTPFLGEKEIIVKTIDKKIRGFSAGKHLGNIGHLQKFSEIPFLSESEANIFKITVSLSPLLTSWIYALFKWYGNCFWVLNLTESTKLS